MKKSQSFPNTRYMLFIKFNICFTLIWYSYKLRLKDIVNDPRFYKKKIIIIVFFFILVFILIIQLLNRNEQDMG